MSVIMKLSRGRWFQGADTRLTFTVEHEVGEDPSTWTYEFVVRRPSASCPGREDPGDGAVVLTVADAAIDKLVNEVTVNIARDDTLGLEPDDYYATLWRVDDPDDNRPLCVLLYAHLTAAARQSA